MDQEQEWTRDDIKNKFPDMPQPSVWQWDAFARYIEWDHPYKTDDPGDAWDGSWRGRCPLHNQEDGEHKMWINFHRGVLQCQADPPCHEGKKAVSLGNAIGMMPREV